MKFPSIKTNFTEAIIDRGYKYYRQGRVKNIIIERNKAKAVVIGSRNYRVKIEGDNFRCTCPYEFNCKHAVAVLYALRKGKNITTIDDIKSKLSRKSKNELVEIIQRVISSEPKFMKFISPPEITLQIRSLKWDDDVDEFEEQVQELHEMLMVEENSLENLIILFKKCFNIWNNSHDAEPLENEIFDMLESISKLANKLPTEERQALIQNLVDLIGDQDFFLDSLDFSGLNIKY